MGAFLVRRVCGLVFVVVAVTFLTFIIGHAAPGDPVQTIMGNRHDPVEHQRLLHYYGLDRPLLQQFGDYLWQIVRYADFGRSFRYDGTPVTTVVGTGLPVTLTIGALALLLATGVGVPIGAWAAVRQNRAGDRVSMTLMLLLYSVPSFVLIPLILTVDIWLEQHHYPSLPVANWGTVQQAILPVAVLAAGSMAYIARLTRTTMVEVLREEFIRTATAKGLPRARVVGKHALRPALLPVVTFLGPSLALLVTSTFVVETIFNLPGVGFTAVTSINARDYPVVQAVAIFVAVSVAVLNACTDVAYRLLDPRIQE